MDLTAKEGMLRIIQVASGDGYAGAEVQLYQLVRQLLGVGDVAVSVVLLNEGQLADRLRVLGVPLLVLDEKVHSSIYIGWRLWSHFLRERPVIVHTHRLKEDVLGALAAALIPGARSIRTVHGSSEFAPQTLSRRKRAVRQLGVLVGRFLQDAIVAVSAELAVRLQRIYPKGKVWTIGNGVDAGSLESAAGGKAVNWPGRPGVARIGFVGRLVPVKRPDLVVQICRAYSKLDAPAADFYLIGEGFLRGAVERLAEEVGVTDRIHLVGAVEDVPVWLRGMDALLLPSDHEGMPMILLEALALGTPVVAHAVGGIPEVLGKARCGLLMPDQEAETWAAALADLLRSPERAAMAARGKKLLREAYTARRCAAGYVKLYKSLSRQAAMSPGAIAATVERRR